MDPAALLAELVALEASTPDFAKYEPTSREHLRWCGRTAALISSWNATDGILFGVTASFLTNELGRASNVGQMLTVLHRTIASLELAVSTLPQQAFGPGAVYDYMKALRELLASASTSLFIVDPYLDDGVFDGYLFGLPRHLTVRILTANAPASVKVGLGKFLAQTKMGVEIRTSGAIHDRVVFVDGGSCWVSGQSIKDAAAKKPTYLAPLAPDVVAGKLASYDAIWAAAAPL